MAGRARSGSIPALTGVVVCIIAIVGAGLPADAQQKMSRAAFCNGYMRACDQTCPLGPGKCGAECRRRLDACRSSGCFHFNVPGARCESNPEDVALLQRPPPSTAPKSSRVTFCAVWAQVCQRNCPQGAGNCGAMCRDRSNACLSSGCFHFDRPRPRCDSNPRDVALSRTPPPGRRAD